MDQPVEEHIDANTAPSSSSSLVPDAVPVGTPLPWSIVDADGTLLFTSGTILATTDDALAARLEDWRQAQTDGVAQSPE